LVNRGDELDSLGMDGVEKIEISVKSTIPGRTPKVEELFVRACNEIGTILW
jgi:hypothetical protein